MQHQIDEHWATHPRSQLHLNFILNAAKNNRRFEFFINQMIKDGICTSDGKLLMKYRDGNFQNV